jgi:hypothetical protein
MAKTKTTKVTKARLANLPPMPTTNSAANPSAARKLEKLWQAACSGDVAAVEAIKTNGESRQTYARMAYRYQQALILALIGECPGAKAKRTKAKRAKQTKAEPQAEQVEAQPQAEQPAAAAE